MFSFLDALSPATIPVSEEVSLAATIARAEDPRGVVVFCHGFTGSKEDFALILPDLAGLGWTCVAYDQRGHYESPHTGDYDLPHLGADAVGVIAWIKKEFGEELPLLLVGHSFGGLIAQQAAIVTPALIDLLVLLCSGPGGKIVDTVSDDLTTERLNQFLELSEGLSSQEIWDLKAKIEMTHEDNPFVLFLKERFVSSDRDAIVAFARMLNETPSLEQQVINSGVTVAWAYGVDDGSWSQALQNRTAEHYGTTPVVIPDAGHNVTLENPEGTTAALDGIFTQFLQTGANPRR